jgi:hypothetical protein
MKHRVQEELVIRAKKREAKERSKKPINVGSKLRRRRHGVGRHRGPSPSNLKGFR